MTMGRIRRDDFQSYKTDFFAMSHPWVMLSVAILLVNDYVLKVYFPSWLTGKLSDLAGLFFFPILLSAVLNIVLEPLKFQPRHIAFSSFWFTALWFTLIKTLPFFSGLTGDILSSLMSLPVKIICDPTDMIALAMLFPAWKLRLSAGNGRMTKKRGLSYAMLFIASLAAMASGPSGNIRVITRLVVHENKIYTYHDYSKDPYASNDPYASSSYEENYYSSDGGQTWERSNETLPLQVVDQFMVPSKLPFTLCLPKAPNTCYRTGKETILESLDGGKTWNVSWRIPLGREEFLSRILARHHLGPYDLVSLDYNGEQVVVAAIGLQGVLVKMSDAPWISVGVDGLGPIYFEARNINEAVDAIDEEIVALGLVAIVLFLVNAFFNVVRKGDQGVYFVAVTLITFFGALGMLGLHFTPMGFTDASPPFLDGSSLLFLNGFAVVMFALQQILTGVGKQGARNLFVLFMTWLVSCSLFLLWAYGVIHVYETAKTIAVVLHVFSMLWVVYFFVRGPIQNKGPVL